MLVDRHPTTPPSTAMLTNALPGRPSVNGHAGRPPVSTYLQYLPAPFHADPLVGRFLLIPEAILAPIEEMLDSIAFYFDPRLTPAELLPWLATWVGVELDENWPLDRQRELVAWAVRLFRWRGTRRGMREHLRVYTGCAPLIVENSDGLRLSNDGTLGENASLGLPRRHWLTLTVFATDPATIDERVVRQIIEFQKPAHVGYNFEIRKVSEPTDVFGRTA